MKSALAKWKRMEQCFRLQHLYDRLFCLFVLSREIKLWAKVVYKEKRKLSVARGKLRRKFTALNPELNPICYLLALLGAHHFLHVSRIRVKS